MDLSVLPDIFALALLIGVYRPLVRRAGDHVDLWFVGWGFILLNTVALLFAGSAGPRFFLLHMTALWSLDLCGLCFILAAANTGKQRVGPYFVGVLSIPVLLQALLARLGAQSPSAALEPLLPVLLHSANFLFTTPAIGLLISRHARRRPLIAISAAFALLGLGTLPICVDHPELVTAATLALIFLSASYVSLLNSTKPTKGVFTVIAGLALWGLKFPIVAALHFRYPGLIFPRGLVILPEYLVVAGSILSQLEEHLHRTERMAMHDPLTDLPNRRLFEERFATAMEEARQQRTTIACLVIDVDNFKHINDSLGHAAGDELLRALAVRLSWHMSPRDILARTGGDEFTAMLAGVTDEHHLRFVASAMMSAASVPVTVEGKSIDVRISIGIALSPDHADTIADLREAADEAMYRAKRRGGNLLAFAGEDTANDPPPLPDNVTQIAPPAHRLKIRSHSSGGQSAHR